MAEGVEEAVEVAGAVTEAEDVAKAQKMEE